MIGAENWSTAPTWDNNVVKDNWQLGPTIQIGLKNQFIPSLNMDLEENMFASVVFVSILGVAEVGGGRYTRVAELEMQMRKPLDNKHKLRCAFRIQVFDSTLPIASPAYPLLKLSVFCPICSWICLKIFANKDYNHLTPFLGLLDPARPYIRTSKHPPLGKHSVVATKPNSNCLDTKYAKGFHTWQYQFL